METVGCERAAIAPQPRPPMVRYDGFAIAPCTHPSFTVCPPSSVFCGLNAAATAEGWCDGFAITPYTHLSSVL